MFSNQAQAKSFNNSSILQFIRDLKVLMIDSRPKQTKKQNSVSQYQLTLLAKPFLQQLSSKGLPHHNCYEFPSDSTIQNMHLKFQVICDKL